MKRILPLAPATLILALAAVAIADHHEKGKGIRLVQRPQMRHLPADGCARRPDDGHEVGDLALIHLADILKRSIRPCDLVARLGGDEFIVYVQDPSDKALLECGEKIRENMERSPLELASETVPFTLSVGAANQYNTGKLSIEELLRFADKAMYDSKASGRNKVSTFQAEETDARRTLRDRA